VELMMKAWSLTLGLFLPLIAACGGESDEPGGSAGSGGSPPSSGGSSGTGGGGTSPGGAGSAGTSSGGSTSAAPDCSGAFGTTELVHFSVPQPATLASPTLTPNELELFYVHYENADAGGSFRRSTRASTGAVFQPGEAVAELDAACQAEDSRSVDLSPDGLRAYLLCFPNTDALEVVGQVRIATRPTLDAAFVLDPEEFGQVGPSPSPSGNELFVYTSSESGIGNGPLEYYERGGVEESFEPGILVPGLENYTLASPDISPDDQHLLAGFIGDVVMTTRGADGSFGPPDNVLPRATNPETGLSISYGAPEFTHDCRSLYAIRLESTIGLSIYGISEVSRL
jgi:hypothetical protein